MKNTILHKANTRGHADHGWLNAHHTFSFASYYEPERVQFGVLRVLNDDIVASGMGFGTHPHDNMEIITIPLEGDLAHKDSMGNTEVIKFGDVQVMSLPLKNKHHNHFCKGFEDLFCLIHSHHNVPETKQNLRPSTGTYFHLKPKYFETKYVPSRVRLLC